MDNIWKIFGAGVLLIASSMGALFGYNAVTDEPRITLQIEQREDGKINLGLPPLPVPKELK